MSFCKREREPKFSEQFGCERLHALRHRGNRIALNLEDLDGMSAVSGVSGFAVVEGERWLAVRAGGHEAKATAAAPNVGKEDTD